MATSTRNRATFFTTSGGAVKLGLLGDEVLAQVGKRPLQITESDDGADIIFQFEVALTGGEETNLDAACNAHGVSPFVAAKKAKNAAIDRRTRQLIDGGFTFNSKKFSLSASAQLSLIAAKAAGADLTFPVKWNTKDDSGTESFVDGPALKAFFLTGLAAARGYIDGGTTLKDSVRAAADVAAVDAVVDNR